ncbi:MAG: hypothetical protein DHS20C11_32960 [Lysobacteraceae bacterium]|nr:MAG: hypothetical protein DHS20C11_32960 [Xanthomonadaceae bacterium]
MTKCHAAGGERLDMDVEAGGFLRSANVAPGTATPILPYLAHERTTVQDVPAGFRPRIGGRGSPGDWPRY